MNKNEFRLRLSDSTHRIYAITGKNKLLGSALSLVIAAEVFFGMFATVWVGLGPCEPLEGFLFVCELMSAFSATFARDQLGPI